MNKTELVYFSEEYSDILDSFELPKVQVQFTSLPGNYKEVTEGQYRIVILNDREPVGFFLLHATDEVKDYSDKPQAMLLTALSINQVKQGKGYAKQALLLLRKFVAEEFPDCNEIVLAVNQKNIAAQKLYLKVGFQDTGIRKMGIIGEQYIMSLKL
ncbi:GNAT family N-acetyltransferase [Bacillus siamensis]|uniref:GNAT family N-acetyltransferase n=1 Tax=Bacillus siamensis TaxID=659243 RepID=UPI0005F97D80|nr:GNAT family N-acetyltransferase [Bacillus siamensis]